MPPTLYRVSHPSRRRRSYKPPVHKSFGNESLRKIGPRNAPQVLETTELLVHILLALPDKSLMRVRSVCKRWNTLSCNTPQLRVRWFRYGIWDYPAMDLRTLDYPMPDLHIGSRAVTGEEFVIDVEMGMPSALLICGIGSEAWKKNSRRSRLCHASDELHHSWGKVLLVSKDKYNGGATRETSAHFTSEWYPRYADHSRLLVCQPPLTNCSAKVVDSRPCRKPRRNVTGAVPNIARSPQRFPVTLASTLARLRKLPAGYYATRLKVAPSEDMFEGLTVRFEGLMGLKNADVAHRRRLPLAKIEMKQHDAYASSSDGVEADDDDADVDDTKDNAEANARNNGAVNGNAAARPFRSWNMQLRARDNPAS